MKGFGVVVGGVAGALLAGSGWAQPPAPEASAIVSQADATQGVEEIVVRGRRMSEIEADLRIHVGEFLEQVAAPPAGRGYARWYRRVCISVNNLERATAQYLVDRMSRLAVEVGLEPGEPGCNPDVIVIFTTDGQGTARELVETQPTLLRPFGDSGVHRGLDALREFAESDRPVRWWHVSLPVDARLGTPAMRVPGEPLNAGATRAVRVAGPSRLHSGVRDELKYVVIIVDGPKLQGRGTTWQQLGDYLAVVALAQIGLESNPTQFDSILNLFSNPAAYSGLTDWDLSYVRSLYSYDQERNPGLQRNEIVGRMVSQELEDAD